jgi:hypothetical protein
MNSAPVEIWLPWVFIIAWGGWFFVRLVVFFVDRFSYINIDFFKLTNWMHRVLFCATTGVLLLLALPGLIWGIGFGFAWGGLRIAANIILFPILLLFPYLLFAFVANMPFFPLSIHAKYFGRAQFLPVIALLPLLMSPMAYIASMLIVAVYAGIWYLCLSDRFHYTNA